MFELSPRDLRSNPLPTLSLPPMPDEAPARPGFIAPGAGLAPLPLLVPPAPASAVLSGNVGAEVHATSALRADANAYRGVATEGVLSLPLWHRLGHFARKAAKIAAVFCAAWALLVISLILLYRFVDPPASALMVQRALLGEDTKQVWVPIDAMSPGLVRAVLVSEDGRFCQHGGIDLDAIQDAIERAGDGTPRGASTISMQVVKNLFLWPGKSYLRKALEVPLTLAIETVWSKRRIMEVYLNVAEWGPGVYGAEAAARYHFSKPALRLSDREAAQLAVTLPNPIRRDAGDPGPGTRRLAGLIQARASAASRYQTACVLRARKANETAQKGLSRP